MHDKSEIKNAEKEFFYYDIATKENFDEKKPKDGKIKQKMFLNFKFDNN
jgi:hypothetical protein